MKFFNRLRRQLLEKNNLKKYLLYALGEIVLVVIGILIALAINNAQQENEIKRKEITYLSGLQKEFEISKKKLATLIEVNRANYKGATQVVSLLADPGSNPDEKELSQLIFRSLYNDIAFNPNNALLNEMIHSGSLKDLSSTTLRKNLTNWLSTLEDIAKQEADLMSHRDHVLDMMRTNDGHLRSILHYADTSQSLFSLPADASPESNMTLFRSPAFENNLLLFILSGQSTEKAHYLPLMTDLEQILNLIENSIADQ
ncbi:hypothetical protein IS446_09620 [Robertkochia sp. 1368]|nr:hypothetical protein [Robertkochia sediminum]